MKKFNSILLLLCCNYCFCQSPNYNIAGIPEALKKDAHTVKRLEKTEFEITDIDKAYCRVQEVTTVLDPVGKDALTFHMPTDKFHSLEDVEIKVYDATGKLIDKFKKKDLSVQSSGEGLVPDGKVNYYRVGIKEYPLTVEYIYTIVYHGIYSYPSYMIQSPGESIERSSYTIKVPKEIDLRFKAMNTTVLPQTDETDKKYKVYSWTVNNLPVKKYEDGSGDPRNNYPWILIAPNKFEYDGYPGEMNSWKSLGMWYNTLVKNDNILSPAFADEIRKMTASATTEKEKIKILYQYLQNNFRYVSIQLGIGGFKPFSANFVHTNKYGDCKALSNYMQACLNAINIKSYSAWIKGSVYPNKVDADFPSDPFNHQILCVPTTGDTTWLECTSNIADFGVLGSFTENRSALLLKEEGGILINTPKSKASDNLYTSTSTINLQPESAGTVAVQLNTTGEYKGDIMNYIVDQKKDDQKMFLMEAFGYLQPDAFEIKYDKSDKTSLVEINYQYEKIPDFVAGNKFFLNPRMYKIWSYNLPKTENRTQDFYFPQPLIKTDTTIYNLPDGFVLETLPKTKEINFEFGNFKSTYQFDEAKKRIITTARLELDEYKIPAAKFATTKKFFDDVLSEYTEKIVIRKL